MSHRGATCLNCGAATPLPFCGECGQRNTDYRESFGELIGEIIDELFQLDARMVRTVAPFLFRPGFLTSEWSAGRRARYSSPLRLYLLTSVLYFFCISIAA